VAEAVLTDLLVALFAVLVEGPLGRTELYSVLLLRGRDQAIIVFRMLMVVLGRDRVSTGRGISRKLRVLVSDVLSGSTDLYVGTV
jgi:hypothetical protein